VVEQIAVGMGDDDAVLVHQVGKSLLAHHHVVNNGPDRIPLEPYDVYADDLPLRRDAGVVEKDARSPGGASDQHA